MDTNHRLKFWKMMCNSIGANMEAMIITLFNVVYRTITLFSIENIDLYY